MESLSHTRHGAAAGGPKRAEKPCFCATAGPLRLCKTALTAMQNGPFGPTKRPSRRGGSGPTGNRPGPKALGKRQRQGRDGGKNDETDLHFAAPGCPRQASLPTAKARQPLHSLYALRAAPSRPYGPGSGPASGHCMLTIPNNEGHSRCFTPIRCIFAKTNSRHGRATRPAAPHKT